MPKPHDALAHRSLSRPDVAAAYLRSVLPCELSKRLDLSGLEVNRLEDRDDVVTITSYILEVSDDAKRATGALDALAANLDPIVREVAMNAAEQLKESGRREAREAMLLEQLKHKFALDPVRLAAAKERLQNASADELRSWSLRFLRVDSFDDVFADPN